MVKTVLFAFCLSALQYQVLSQCPRQLNYLRQIQPEIEVTRNYIPPTLIPETTCSCQLPNNPAPSHTTIITDCSPTACKNLANTLQLMIVCNLLQNTKQGSEMALQLAAPIINELFTSPVLSCGCNNPFASNVVSPNFISGFSNAVSTTGPLLQLTAGGLLSGVY